MKANAPEKIYVYIPDDDIVGTASTQKSFPHQFVTEEYTRTDAFIEKAENFFTETFDVEDYNDILDVDGSPIFNYGRFIEDLINYMKGE